jgi:hypothetical protein
MNNEETMKKLLAILAIVTLCSGCVLTTKINNILGTVEDTLCSPTVDQVTDAAAALSFIQANPKLAGGLGSAIAVFNSIKSGICVAIPQLRAALGSLDGAIASMGFKGMAGASPIPALTALRKVAK